MTLRILLLSIPVLLVPAPVRAEPPIDFAEQIQPLLSDRCFICHGPDADSRQADLRLDLKEAAVGAISSDETTAIVAPGKPEASVLIQRIMSDDSDLVMPPPDSNLSLTTKEKDLLNRWVKEGARWNQHWSFAPIQKPSPPSVSSAPKLATAIDHFIQSRLDAAEIAPSGRATRERLIRRASFDLTGLPPTLAEIDAFLADDSDNAFENVLDRLLTSKHFGERMAADWLDVARYSDTYGYQVDRDRYVWPWRDWVVRAFNDNMPYDRFITEQLAGDLLPDATRNQILATTFNRLHPQKVEGGSVPEEFRVEYVADRAQTVATAFLGLTMECCRCHDHKYDPLAQKDYFRFFSFFNSIDEAGLYSYFTNSVPTPTLQLPNDQQEQKLAETLAAKQAAEATVKNAEQQIQEPERQQELLNLLKTKATALLANPEQIIPGQVAQLDFEKGSFGKNAIVDGPVGQAVQLTGDHAIDTKQGNFPRWQPFSVSTWINSPKSFDRCVVFHRSRAWTDAASRGYEMLIEDGHLSVALIHFWPGNAIRIRATEPLPLNEWQHVAVTYDGSSRANGLRLWINGRPAATEIVRDNLYRNITGGGGDNIHIGQRFRDIGFARGMVDDFRIFNRELTGIEVQHTFDGKALTAALKSDTFDDETSRNGLAEYAAKTLNEDYRAKLTELQNARKTHCVIQDSLTEIMVMDELPSPRLTYVLKRGAYDAPGEEVTSNVPAALPQMDDALPNNRLGLAKWLCSPDNPLTARVAVNRLWQMLFGHGLVRTPEDFGSQGLRPSHPELLDWLAADFRESNWDVKRFLKQIMMSDVYQRSSRTSPDQFEKDSENSLLARFPVFRLPAEMLRDNALAISGLLNRRLGGPPVKPYELAASFKPSKPDKGDGLYRRSLYTYWKRTAPAPMMMTLDASKREVCRVKREQTASPLQPLVVMNGPQFVEAARLLAHRLIVQHGQDDNLILSDMVRLTTGRQPKEREVEALTKLLNAQQTHFEQNPAEAGKYLDVGDKKTPTDDAARLAAWTSVANTLVAYDECMMKR